MPKTTILGKVSLTPQGDFVLGTAYHILDVVYSPADYAAFVALQDNENVGLEDTAVWMKLVQGMEGKSAYTAASEAGYAGTEEEFYTELAGIAASAAAASASAEQAATSATAAKADADRAQTVADQVTGLPGRMDALEGSVGTKPQGAAGTAWENIGTRPYMVTGSLWDNTDFGSVQEYQWMTGVFQILSPDIFNFDTPHRNWHLIKMKDGGLFVLDLRGFIAQSAITQNVLPVFSIDLFGNYTLSQNWSAGLDSYSQKFLYHILNNDFTPQKVGELYLSVEMNETAMDFYFNFLGDVALEPKTYSTVGNCVLVLEET